MKKHRTPSKIYSLALFRKIQGKTVRICSVESWYFSTVKRDAERKASRLNRDNGYITKDQLSCDIDKWIQVETL